jgi:hypothetical protein
LPRTSGREQFGNPPTGLQPSNMMLAQPEIYFYQKHFETVYFKIVNLDKHFLMNTASIRQQLISDISAASEDDLKKIYRLHTLLKEEKLNGITWKNLTAEQKNKIETGLEQLKAGKGIPVKKL